MFEMLSYYRKDLATILKRRRLLIPMTLRELSARSGVSASYLDSIERGERFPSVRVLRKVSGPLGYEENDLFMLTGFLSHGSPIKVNSHESHSLPKGLDPYIGAVLAQEPLKVQRAVLGMLHLLRCLTKSFGKE